jgi:hypothetical protein
MPEPIAEFSEPETPVLQVDPRMVRQPLALVELLKSYESLTHQSLDIHRLYSGLRFPKGTKIKPRIQELLRKHSDEQLSIARKLVTRTRGIAAVARLQWELDSKVGVGEIRDAAESGVQALCDVRWSWRGVFQQALDAEIEVKSMTELRQHLQQISQRHEAVMRESQHVRQFAHDLSVGAADLDLLQEIQTLNERQVWSTGPEFGVGNGW